MENRNERDMHKNQLRDLVQFQMRDGDPHPTVKGEQKGGKELAIKKKKWRKHTVHSG